MNVRKEIRILCKRLLKDQWSKLYDRFIILNLKKRKWQNFTELWITVVTRNSERFFIKKRKKLRNSCRNYEKRIAAIARDWKRNSGDTWNENDGARLGDLYSPRMVAITEATISTYLTSRQTLHHRMEGKPKTRSNVARIGCSRVFPTYLCTDWGTPQTGKSSITFPSTRSPDRSFASGIW